MLYNFKFGMLVFLYLYWNLYLILLIWVYFSNNILVFFKLLLTVLCGILFIAYDIKNNISILITHTLMFGFWITV